MNMPAAIPYNPIHQDLDRVMMRMGSLWEQFRNESVFITGGTGLFGRWLLESMARANRQLDLNVKVTVLTRDAAAFRRQAPQLAQEPGIDFHQGDVRDFDFPAARYAYIIHGAATSANETFQGEDPLRKFDTIVTGTRHTLDFAAHCGARRLLLLSSGSAYGVPGNDMTDIPETYTGAPETVNPDSALGQAKRTAEFLAASYASQSGLEFVIARCFSFVGPFLPLDIHYAIGNFISHALREAAITVKGDGTPVRSYLYMADLMVWLLTLLARGRNGQIYNVGSDQALSVRDLAYMVRAVVSPGKPVAILGQPAYSVGNEVRNVYVPNIAKARTELGLGVWTDLESSIRLTAAYISGAHACH